MPEPVPVIAVDGTAGSGKGTLALRLRCELGFHLLDSGLLYRAVAVAVLQKHDDCTDEEICTQAARTMRLELRSGNGDARVRVNDADVSAHIRHPDIGRCASQAAAFESVRTALLPHQREQRIPPGLVADGRDMGSTVFPDAILKIYLDAEITERARRRQLQLKEKGISATLVQLVGELEQRDLWDTERAASPLVVAPDALSLDTTRRSADEIYETVRERMQSLGLVAES